jgi:hypothetical protein
VRLRQVSTEEIKHCRLAFLGILWKADAYKKDIFKMVDLGRGHRSNIKNGLNGRPFPERYYQFCIVKNEDIDFDFLYNTGRKKIESINVWKLYLPRYMAYIKVSNQKIPKKWVLSNFFTKEAEELNTELVIPILPFAEDEGLLNGILVANNIKR